MEISVLLENMPLLAGWILFMLLLFLIRASRKFRPIRFPLFLLLVSMTLYQSAKYFHFDRLLGISLTIFTLSVAFLLSRLIVFLAFEAFPKRKREIPFPALMKTMVFFILFAISLLIINEFLPEAKRFDPASIVASAAVVSVVLGFALQDTLGNLFSGLALHLEHPVREGDWIRIGDNVGEVVETAWRSIKLRTLQNDYLIIPNSEVASKTILNYHDPRTPHRRDLKIRAPYDASPDTVEAAIIEILDEIEGIDNSIQPKIIFREFREHWTEYEVRYWYKNFKLLEQIDAEVRRRTWYAFDRFDISHPLPSHTVYLHEDKPVQELTDEKRSELVKWLRNIEVFAPLSASELASLSDGMKCKVYAKGEKIIQQGDSGDSFFLLFHGSARLDVNSSQIGSITRGDYFGEMALLTGEKRTATIVALQECTCYVLEKNLFAQILERKPGIASEMSEILGQRQAQLEELANANENIKTGDAQGDRNFASTILRKIKSYFRLA